MATAPRSSGERARSARPARSIALGLVAAVGLAACVLPPPPFADEFYVPVRVRQDPAPVALTVHAFTDARPGDRRVVFRDETEGHRPALVYATAPVGLGVARAFVRGFAARGHAVTDASTRDYRAGAPLATPIAITGRVDEFDAHVGRRTVVLSPWRAHVGCRVRLQTYDAAGRPLFDRDYARVVEGALAPTEPLAALARALADVVEQAVSDPDVTRALHASRG